VPVRVRQGAPDSSDGSLLLLQYRRLRVENNKFVAFRVDKSNKFVMFFP